MPTGVAMRKLNVVAYRKSWDAIHEALYFTDVTLGGVKRPRGFTLLEYGDDIPVKDDILIVNLCNGARDLVVQAVNQGGRNIGVVGWCHTISEDYSYYPFVDYVLRPYFSPPHFTLPEKARCQEICWIPNGYKSGIGPRNPAILPAFADRPIEFFYSGFPNTNPGERSSMLAVMQASQLPATLNITKDFSDGLSLNTYRTTMEQTRFALVPGGANAETIRLFEALEMGTIPISLNHAFLQDDRAMAGAPIVRLNDWAELPAWYQMVKSAPNYLDLMEEYRQGIARWWADFKVRQQQKVADVIDRSFQRY